ncbi:hypothetical protein IFM89_033385 [Coptis chinensis]|uniref:RNase H type-1 domain-containing protein n=1 Tax=Coptis chinensis TaxID=261450 RepID=A0A835HH04_9MAGN|nr:hypothetical protein IFM89_033385 [Coptis chinensis]
MLNTDGSVQQTGNGYGGTICNALGNITRAYAGSSSKHSVIFQEIHAIAIGLKQAQDLGIDKLEVNSDSLGAINILNGFEPCPCATLQTKCVSPYIVEEYKPKKVPNVWAL